MKWEYTIPGLKSEILCDRDNFTTEELKQKTTKLVEILKSHSFMSVFLDEYDYLLNVETVESVEDFNEILDTLYDYCDQNSIWLGE